MVARELRLKTLRWWIDGEVRAAIDERPCWTFVLLHFERKFANLLFLTRAGFGSHLLWSGVVDFRSSPSRWVTGRQFACVRLPHPNLR